jgi:hypothetical protein
MRARGEINIRLLSRPCQGEGWRLEKPPGKPGEGVLPAEL